MLEFGDDSPDDVLTVGDDEVNWSRVEELADRIEAINAIEDPNERLTAAVQWANDLNGVSNG